MASPKEVLVKATMVMNKAGVSDSYIKELVSKVFTSRNSLHFAHLYSKSYSEHEALEYLYTSIVNKMDDIVEAWQGKYGLLSGLSSAAASAPSDVCNHVKEESKWVMENKELISQGCETIGAMIDELSACYLKAIYKLENLK